MPESEYRDDVTLLTGEACLQLKAIDGTGRRSGCVFGKTIKHFCVAHAFLTGTIAAHAPGKPIRYITGWRESGTIVILRQQASGGQGPTARTSHQIRDDGLGTCLHAIQSGMQSSAYIIRGVAQPGRVLRSGRRSRRFESSHPDQFWFAPARYGPGG